MKKMRSRSIWALVLTAVMLIATLGIVDSGTVYAEPEQYDDGARMSDLLFQFYLQDGSANNYLWHDYSNTNPVYNQATPYTWELNGADTFAGALDSGVTIGFQLSSTKMQEGETASIHFVLSDIVISFYNYEDIVIDQAFDMEEFWLCTMGSWGGLTGNGTAITVTDYFTQAEPALMAKDIRSVSFNLLCDYLEYGTSGPRAEASGKVMDLVKKMGTGVTISNAFDVPTATGDEITEEMINAYQKMGYKTIRIPVCMDNHIGADYSLESGFFAKLKDVIDIIVSKDMYAILSLEGSGGWMEPKEANQSAGQTRLEQIWTNIANEFTRYDEYLLFETMSEPVVGREVTGKDEYFTTLNRWNAACVAAIRATGGENETRAILLPSYYSSYSLVSKMDLPNDPNIIVSVNMNIPYTFTYVVGATGVAEWDTTRDGTTLRNAFSSLQTTLEGKNVPVIITEYNAANKDNYGNRVNFAYDFAKLAKEFGYVCLWNDNGIFAPNTTESYGLLNRSTCEWVFTSIAEASIAGEAWGALPVVSEDPNYPEDMETNPAPTEAEPNGETPETSGQQQTNPAPAEEEGNSNIKVIVTIIFAVVFLGALIAVAVVFKKRNGSLF